MNCSIFDHLTWNHYGEWESSIVFNVFGKLTQLDVVIRSESEDTPLSDLQRESYCVFMDRWDDIREDVLEKIYLYYQEEREELGYEDNSNPDYPAVTSKEKIISMISPDMILIDETDLLEDFYDGDRAVTLRFSCSWDEENGFGITFVNEQIVEISPDAGL